MNFSVKNLNLTNDPNNITKAIGTLCIEDVFHIEGVTVKRSKDDNMYVQLPQRSYNDKETQEKKYKDVCYPINKELRAEITKVVLDTYYEKLKEREDMQEESQKKTSKSVKSKAKKEEVIEEQEDEEVL